MNRKPMARLKHVEFVWFHNDLLQVTEKEWKPMARLKHVEFVWFH